MTEERRKPDRDRILASPPRRLMLQVIEDDPGIFVTELHAILTLDTGTFYYHLKMLREAGIVEEHKVQLAGSLRKALYPAGHAPEPGREDDPLFSDAGQRVAAVLLKGKGVSSAEIVAETGLSDRTVQRYLGRLMDAGLVTDKREGRNISYYSTPRLNEAWEKRPNQ